MPASVEASVLNEWYVIDALTDVAAAPKRNRLLGRDLMVCRTAAGACAVRTLADQAGTGVALPTLEFYGCLWTSLGTPAHPPVAIPEAAEPDRRQVLCGAVRVKASGLRIVENFLDMAHFPFVHTGILGAEPQTEVRPHTAEIRRDVDEVWATDCMFYQPQAALSASRGSLAGYVYRVATPFVTLLYKTCPSDPDRSDVVCLFVQPLDPDCCRAHPVLFVLDAVSSHSDLVRFQQLIFLQDRTILENQRPRLLPLEPRAEIPTRADLSSIAYRRWLKEKGVTYGTAERGDAAVP